MDLKNISNLELTQRLEKLARTERKITHLVLLHINEMESRRLYADLGYDGMYSYLTKGLGYSESSAYRRLQSARLLIQIPAIADKLESGSLNLSQLTQVQKCLKEEIRTSGGKPSNVNTQRILKEIENKNTFETQKILTLQFNQPPQKSQMIKPQADDSVRLEITFSGEDYTELQKAKELLSHICPNGSWSEIIVTLAKKFNKAKVGSTKENSTQSFAAKKTNRFEEINRQCKIDKGRKIEIIEKIEKINADERICDEAKIANEPKVNNETKSLAKVVPTMKRQYISLNIRRELFIRADHRCQFKSRNGKTCGSTYQLQIDHIFPKALGGVDHPQNLRVLCRSHNLLMAERFDLIKPS
ncbi:HNH endonuclease [Bdellovibrio sp.]|uniref:HNH endonuclease n=1 Tax=Bdellovibrio sp. TaxID=28201 RepID=UPI0039E49A51